MTDKLRFTPAFREEVRLRDGTVATLRLVIPADKVLLARGMDRFSPESRYHRFLAAKQVLTDADLRYLTEVNGLDHFAIGALIIPDEGIGVARFVRFDEDREVAEPSLAVLDAYQHKGLGELLFRRLMAAARERGIRRFHGRMLSDNEPMRRLLLAMTPHLHFAHEDQVMEFDMLLED